MTSRREEQVSVESVRFIMEEFEREKNTRRRNLP